MKQFSALIAAFLITGAIGFAMFSVGSSALLNKNTVPTLNSPTAQASTTSSQTTTGQSQVQQMQNLIAQYQQRDQQYQTQLNQVETQLNQADNQIQQYQSLLKALQSQGVILIGPDGRILIPGR